MDSTTLNLEDIMECNHIDSQLKLTNESIDREISAYFNSLPHDGSEFLQSRKRLTKIVKKIDNTISSCQKKISKTEESQKTIHNCMGKLGKEIMRRKYALDSENRGSCDAIIDRNTSFYDVKDIKYDDFIDCYTQNKQDPSILFLFLFVINYIINSDFSFKRPIIPISQPPQRLYKLRTSIHLKV
ncbi:hypothetical protein MXB_3255 [Myxobolus squamalis]|nr:hypothetical protein MXB_3255 [Myxobolus squamalis]